nr:P0 protein [Carrot polerovirus 2]
MGPGYIRFLPSHLREFVLWGLLCGYYPKISRQGWDGHRASTHKFANRGAYIAILQGLDICNFQENIRGYPEFFLKSAEDFSKTLGVFLQIHERHISLHYQELSLDRCLALVSSVFMDCQDPLVLRNIFYSTCPRTSYSYLLNRSGLPCAEMDLFTAPYALITSSLDHNEVCCSNEIIQEEDEDSDGEGL